MDNYGTPQLALERGEGAYVWDTDGNRYLDLLTGIAVNALGHAHPKIVEAVTRQISKIGHTSNLYVNEPALKLAERLLDLVLAQKPADVDALLGLEVDGQTVAALVESESARIGEKLVLSRFAVFEGTTATYLHKRATDLPPAIGVAVQYSGGTEEAARSLAMHIAAARPRFLSRDEVPAETVETERRVAEQTAKEEGKPEQAIVKIVEGRVNAYYKDFVLLEQPSITDPKRSVKQIVDEAGVTVERFARFEVGQA